MFAVLNYFEHEKDVYCHPYGFARRGAMSGKLGS